MILAGIPIFIEIRGIVSYTTNERDMAWFH